MTWDFSVVYNNADALFSAFYRTVFISFLSILFGTLFGVILGVLSLSHNKLAKFVAKFIIEIFLALPILVLIIWMYYCFPLISKRFLFSAESVAIISLSLSLSAFVAQIVRSGINIIPKGQMEVAYCLGFTRFQAIRYILIPQAINTSLPALMGQYITCYKMSTLAAIIGVDELLHTSGNIISQTYRPIEIYTSLAIIFLITVYPLNRLAKRFEKTKQLGGTENL